MTERQSIRLEEAHDPAVLVLNVVRGDIAEMRREWRQDIKDLRAEMVTQAEYRASERAHSETHNALRADIEALSAPPRWPAIAGGIGSLFAIAVAVLALLQR